METTRPERKFIFAIGCCAAAAAFFINKKIFATLAGKG
jgi:hypothetical protein